MKTMPPKGGFLLSVKHKVSQNKQCYTFYLAKTLSIAIVFIFSFAILHSSNQTTHKTQDSTASVGFTDL